MEWLNYHHLFYFWSVTRAGSITRACKELRLSQPTISSQIKALEEVLGSALFERSGKRLILTEKGQMVFRYAEQIFTLGREMVSQLRTGSSEEGVRLNVGIVDALPKTVAYRLLRPALKLTPRVSFYCPEDTLENLLAEMALHKLDLILADVPLPPGLAIRAWHHLLGESSISIFASNKLKPKREKKFPQLLDRSPFLLPAQSGLRASLETWFDETQVRPSIVGEFADSALLNMFGQAGEGMFAAPTVIEDELKEHYGLRCLGRVPGIKERYYAISPARQTKNTAVVAILEQAKTLFDMSRNESED